MLPLEDIYIDTKCCCICTKDYKRIRRTLKNYRLDLYKAPIVRINLLDAIQLLGLRRRFTLKISRKLLKLISQE